MEKLWTTTEVAQYLGISEAEVEQLVRAGTLTGYKLGGKFLRFRPDQVEGLKPKLGPPKAQSPAAVNDAAWRWQERLGDFLYFYDLYLVSAGLLIGLVVYLIAAGS